MNPEIFCIVLMFYWSRNCTENHFYLCPMVVFKDMYSQNIIEIMQFWVSLVLLTHFSSFIPIQLRITVCLPIWAYDCLMPLRFYEKNSKLLRVLLWQILVAMEYTREIDPLEGWQYKKNGNMKILHRNNSMSSSILIHNKEVRNTKGFSRNIQNFIFSWQNFTFI